LVACCEATSGGSSPASTVFTWGGYAMIEWLWVDAGHRHEGLGTRLVRAAEDEAVRRGCVVVRVNTHTFQAPGFYEALGYSPIGLAEDTPVGHEEVFFEMRLVDRTADPGDRGGSPDVPGPRARPAD
jgi:ribosomal protein S18 acetylase RimI-like enzyme